MFDFIFKKSLKRAVSEIFISNIRLSDYTIRSPDNTRVAYTIKIGVGTCVVMDGNEGKHYDGGVYGLTFSPDCKCVAYKVRIVNETFVVRDEQEGKRYDDIKSKLIFSPDSKHLAYVTEVYVATGEHKGYNHFMKANGSKKLIKVGYKCFVVLDGKEKT